MWCGVAGLGLDWRVFYLDFVGLWLTRCLLPCRYPLVCIRNVLIFNEDLVP